MNTQISLDRSTILLTKNNHSSSKKIVLFIPGISGDAFSDVFQPLVDMSIEAGLPIARVSAWESHETVQKYTFLYYQEALIEVIDYLLRMGYQEIIAVGKSFGGGLLLALHHEAILKKILWAPAIGFSDIETISDLKNTLLSEIDNLKLIAVSQSFIQKDKAELSIIHGTADTVMSIETSREIVSCLENATLSEVQGADHSFRTPESQSELMRITKECIVSS